MSMLKTSIKQLKMKVRETHRSIANTSSNFKLVPTRSSEIVKSDRNRVDLEAHQQLLIATAISEKCQNLHQIDVKTSNCKIPISNTIR